LMSETGLQATTNIAYAWGAGAEWIVESKWFIAAASFSVIGGLAILSTIGLGAGKWLHGAGGLTMVVILTATIALPIVYWANGGRAHVGPLSLAMPALSRRRLYIFGVMGLGALGA